MTRKQKKARAKQRRADELRRASASNQRQSLRITELEDQVRATQAAFEREFRARTEAQTRAHATHGNQHPELDPQIAGWATAANSVAPGTIRAIMQTVAEQTLPARSTSPVPTGETQVFDIERGGLNPVVPVPPDAALELLQDVRTRLNAVAHDELFKLGVYVRLLEDEATRTSVMYSRCAGRIALALGMDSRHGVKVWAEELCSMTQDYLFWNKASVELLAGYEKPRLHLGMPVVVNGFIGAVKDIYADGEVSVLVGQKAVEAMWTDVWPLPLLSWEQPPAPEEPIEDASLPWKRGAL